MNAACHNFVENTVFRWIGMVQLLKEIHSSIATGSEGSQGEAKV